MPAIGYQHWCLFQSPTQNKYSFIGINTVSVLVNNLERSMNEKLKPITDVEEDDVMGSYMIVNFLVFMIPGIMIWGPFMAL